MFKTKCVHGWQVLFVFLIFLSAAPQSHAAHLTSLGTLPDWSALNQYQKQITHSDFRWLLDTHYAPHSAWHPYITLKNDYALIQTNPTENKPPFRLNFLSPSEEPFPTAHYWKKKESLSASFTQDKPLNTLHIALDPGHIGGEFAAMEQRSWRLPDGPLIKEGEIVLQLAQRLKPQLESLGATVSLTRAENKPVTRETPDTLKKKAIAWHARKNKNLPGMLPVEKTHSPEAKARQIKNLSNLLFYRVSEIHTRAELINHTIQPDIVLALHINGEAFPPGPHKTLVSKNHTHVLINGAYSADELAFDDQRFEMLIKLLNRSWEVERPLGKALANSLAQVTDLPPFTYHGNNAIRVNESPYLWARNLLANRRFQCPVIFLEPYVANSKDVYPRLVALLKKDNTQSEEPDILDEYCEGIVQGLLSYYQ